MRYATKFLAAISLLSAIVICDVSDAEITKQDSRIRLWMRNLETVSEAVMAYRVDRNEHPQNLTDLVPDYLSRVPSAGCSGSIAYSHDAVTFTVSAQLCSSKCGVSRLRMKNNGWDNYPRCVLTDEEKHWMTQSDLRRIATALEAYFVDYNEYPESADQLVPVYTYHIAQTDAYGKAYVLTVQPESYTLIGYGSDRQPGGEEFKTDTLFSSEPPFEQGLPLFSSEFDYAINAMGEMRTLAVGLEGYVVDHGEYPATLDLIFPTYVSIPMTGVDLYGREYQYQKNAALDYILTATGKNGVTDDDALELKIHNAEFTKLPDFYLLFYYKHHTGIFNGGLLP